MRLACGFVCIAFCLFLGVTESKADSCISVGNLVANCGFETGTFSSWSLSGNDVPLGLNILYGVEGVDPLDGIHPDSGTSQAFFTDLDANATTLKQTIITAPAHTYTVSWFLAQDTAAIAPSSNEFSASFGGVTLVSLTAVPVEGYTEYSYTATALSSSSVL